jgi:hypothetical protein
VVFLTTTWTMQARTVCWHLRNFFMLHMRPRLYICFLPIHLQKFMVGSKKSVMPFTQWTVMAPRFQENFCCCITVV